jgi:predicted DCC family thiol-disulfide oxidoreductase YuxK
VSAIPEVELEQSWQFVLPDGKRLTEGQAAVALFEATDALRWLGRTLRVLRLTPVVTVIYRIVSSLRPQLGRVVRDAPGPRRLP